MSDQHSHTGQTWRLEHDSLGDVPVPAERYWGHKPSGPGIASKSATTQFRWS